MIFKAHITCSMPTAVNDCPADLVRVDESVADLDYDEFTSSFDEDIDIHKYDLTTEYNVKGIIDKVRSVVRSFRLSPTKNDDILQTRVLEKHQKRLSLIIDIKTRWSSTFLMIRRFVCLKKSISFALVDLGGQITFDFNEWELLEILCFGDNGDISA